MTQLVDDQLLGTILRGGEPPEPGVPLFTTGYWYVRLCQAVLTATARPGALSGPFLELPDDVRQRAVDALMQLPDEVGLLSLRELGPVMGRLRAEHELNVLGMEALAAAMVLDGRVYLSAPSPRLQAALASNGRTATVV